MLRFLKAVSITIVFTLFAFHISGCSTQGSSEQDDAASAQEPIVQLDERLVRRLPAEHPDAVLLTTATTQYVMLGGEAFLPGRPGDYTNSFGAGGACISSGSNAMAAPVQLPQGAVITGFRVFFNDTSSTTDLSVTLDAYSPASGFYFTLATLNSSGINGLDSRSTASIAAPSTVDNTNYAYDVRAFSTSWNCNMHINGAMITYAL